MSQNKSGNTHIQSILVVEDEPAICEFCQRVLASAGFRVDVATNGEVAQEMIAERQYHLYLIDIRLPVMDGRELYYWLKEKQPSLARRVIFTTGSVLGRDTAVFLEQSGRPWLPKPFTPGELKAIVEETLAEVEK